MYRRLAITSVALLCFVAPALGATIEVSEDCTIEDAILAANTDSDQGGCPAGSGSDTILLPSGTFRISQSLEIVGNVSLVGQGQGKTIIDGERGRFGFIIVGSTSESGSVGLSDLTIKRFEPGTNAPLYVRQGSSLDLYNVTIRDKLDNFGIGAITVSGSAVVIASAITNNRSFRTMLYVDRTGSLTLIRSAVVGNEANSTGAITNEGTTQIENSTISDNKALLENGVGAITVLEGSVRVSDSTIAFNQGLRTGGIFNTVTGGVTLQNSILASNRNRNKDQAQLDTANCSGELESGGHNLFPDVQGCSIGGQSPPDLLVTDAMLDPELQNLGATADNCRTRSSGEEICERPTAPPLKMPFWGLMHKPLPGSMAIGPDFSSTEPQCPRFDQRGIRRGGRPCDIGAVEVGTALLVFDKTSDHAGDVALKDHLVQELAFVTIRDTFGTPDTAGKNLVIISESAPSADAGKRFRDVRAPVLVTEPGAFDDMFMTGPGRDDFGVSQDQTSVTIVNPAHFTAAGLKGTIRTTESPQRYAFGRNLAPGAKCTARPSESSTRCMIFSIGKGQALFNRMRSPARRVGFFAVEGTFSALTAEGLRLFDAAVLWAAQGESQ